MNAVILLTACVNPMGMSKTTLQNSKVRLEQYISTINFYIENTNYQLCICENTGTDLSKYFKFDKNDKRIEFLSFMGNNYDKSKGKGYGEALIIEYAIKNSILINSESHIIKISGRYIIRNIDIQLNYIEELAKKKDISLFVFASYMKYHFCSSFFYIAPTSFFQSRFLERKNQLNDTLGFGFEELLFEETILYVNCYQKKLVILPFPLIVDAISGTSGKPYNMPTNKDYKRSKNFNQYTYKFPILTIFYKMEFSIKRCIKNHISANHWNLLHKINNKLNN